MILLTTILAQGRLSRRLQGLESAFKPSETETTDWGTPLLLVAAIIGIVLVMLVSQRIRRRQAGELFANQPYRLFSHVLKELGVGFGDRLLMRRAARKCGLRQPAVMLFNPDLMERTIGRWADTISVSPLRTHVRQRLEAVIALAFAK